MKDFSKYLIMIFLNLVVSTAGSIIARIIVPALSLTLIILIFMGIFSLLLVSWFILSRLKSWKCRQVKPSKVLPMHIFKPESFDEFKSTEILRKLMKEATILLFEDRLETGGWGKTYFWRRQKSKEKVFPVGSLTGTLVAYEPLFHGLRYEELPLSLKLRSNLDRILLSDGRYIKGFEQKTTGLMPVYENVRHMSSGFELRIIINKKILDKDAETLKKILSKIDNLNDQYDLSIASKAIIRNITCKNGVFRKESCLALKRVWDKLLSYLEDLKDFKHLFEPRFGEFSLSSDIVQWHAFKNYLTLICFSKKRGWRKEVKEYIRKVINKFLCDYEKFSCGTLIPESYETGENIPMVKGLSIFSSCFAIFSAFTFLSHLGMYIDNTDKRLLKELIKKIYCNLLKITPQILRDNSFSFDEKNIYSLTGYWDCAGIILAARLRGIIATKSMLRDVKKEANTRIKCGKSSVEKYFKELNLKTQYGLYEWPKQIPV